MEKLFLSLIGTLLFFCSFSVNAQEYAVFKSNGKSINIVNNTENSIKKGNVITKGIISVIAKDTLLLLDTNGVFYQLNTEKKYALADISSYEKQQSEEGFSKKYFSYVWKQMKSKDQTPNHTGNVYREDKNNALTSPKDSISIYKNEIEFTWEENIKQEHSYFFLKNTSTNSMTIIKIDGTSLSLFTDNNVLVKGNSYSWGIAHEKYPAFDRVKFNSFDFLSQEQYSKYILKYNHIKKDLNKLGYTNTEINKFICEYFNLCTE